MKPNSGLDQLLQLAQLGAVMAQQQQAQQDIQLRQMMAQLGYQENVADREMRGQQFQQGQEFAERDALRKSETEQAQLGLQKQGFEASREEANRAEKIALRAYLDRRAATGEQRKQGAQARMDATRDRAVAEKRGERETKAMELDAMFNMMQGLYGMDPTQMEQFAGQNIAPLLRVSMLPKSETTEKKEQDAQLRVKTKKPSDFTTPSQNLFKK